MQTIHGNTVGGLIGSTNFNASGSALTVKDEKTGNIILNNYVMGTVTGPEGSQYFGAVIGDMGGSSGSLLKTFTGNIVSNVVNVIYIWQNSRLLVWKSTNH